jgi:hypothetical protein
MSGRGGKSGLLGAGPAFGAPHDRGNHIKAPCASNVMGKRGGTYRYAYIRRGAAHILLAVLFRYGSRVLQTETGNTCRKVPQVKAVEP